MVSRDHPQTYQEKGIDRGIGQSLSPSAASFVTTLPLRSHRLIQVTYLATLLLSQRDSFPAGAFPFGNRKRINASLKLVIEGMVINRISRTLEVGTGAVVRVIREGKTLRNGQSNGCANAKEGSGFGGYHKG